MRHESGYPSFLMAVGLFILAQAIAIVLTSALSALPVVGDREGLDILGTAIGYALVIGYAYRRTGRSGGEVFPLRPISGLGVVAVVLATLGLLVVQWVVDVVVVAVLPVPEWFEALYDELFAGSVGVGFVRVAIVAPVGEELLMRGVFLAGFAARYGRRNAIILSSVVFAIAHANPWQAVPAFLAGILFGWWTLRAGSLVPALVAHTLGNAAIYAGTVAPERLPGLAAADDTLAWPEPVVVLVGLALLGCGLALSARLFRHHVA